MRCQCCDKNLSDYESTLRHAETNEFLDTCLRCLRDTGIPTLGRPDLNPYEQVEEDIFDNHEDSLFEEDSYD